MTVGVIVVGRAKGPIEPAIREFELRAARYWKLEVVEVDAGAAGRGRRDSKRLRESEGLRIRGKLPARGELWILTREGTPMSSSELAQLLGERAVAGCPAVTFVIGGASGLDPDLVRSADRALSLSQMTLPHAAARMILAEQLYRAGTILRGEPYHKGAQ